MTALAGVGTLVTIVGAGAGIAYAASPVTDYAAYPSALPSGCPTGSASLEGLQFTNGRGGSSWSLAELDVRHGDTVTMSWTGFHDRCTTGNGGAAITVSLAAYDSPSQQWDPEVDQDLQAGWAACGPDADTACTPSGGRMSLSITVPSTAVCNVQIDAAQGLPLAVVGPSGSYYSDWERGNGSNRLISAANFGLEPCVAPTTSVPETTPPPAPQAPAPEAPAPEAPVPVAPETPSTPLVSAPPETTTTTEAPPADELPEATTSTTPEAVAPQAAPPSTATPTTSTSTTAGPTRVLDASVTAPTPSATVAGVLPFTGSDTFGTLRLAGLLTGVGGATLLAAGALHLQRRRQA